MIDSKAIGQRIKEARLARGIETAKALAEALKKAGRNTERADKLARLSRQTVEHWEKGGVVPPWDKLELMASVFGEEYDEAWIMFGTRRSKQLASEKPLLVYLTEEEAALVNEYRHANEDGRKSIMTNAKAIAREFPLPSAGVHLMRRSTDLPRK